MFSGRRVAAFLFILTLLIGGGLYFNSLALVVAVSIVILGFLVCWYLPLVVGTAAMAVGPLLGLIISIPWQRNVYSQRLFGGSIDIPFSDAFALAGLLSVGLWVLKSDGWKSAWKRLPFLGSYVTLVGAHVLSAFSSAQPDFVGVVKFSMRPVAFSYAAFVALPTVLLRRWKDVRRSFALFVWGAGAFALQGFASLFVDERWTTISLHRARPLPIFGYYPIGANHNTLAEWLVVAAPFALALASWTHHRKLRPWLMGLAGFCALIALLTFARSAWIVVACELALLFATVWRPYVQKIWKVFSHFAWILVVPFVGYMLSFSLSQQVSTSTDARAMLTGIAWRWFSLHPLVGAGAGTFVAHVGSTWAYRLLFGGAMDAHGVFQKLFAETGLVGVGAYLLVTGVIVHLAWVAIKRIGWEHRMGQGLMYSAVGIMGAWIYQIFNTTYWSAKLWLPIGLFFAAAALCRRAPRYE